VSVLPGHKGANKYGADPLEAIGSSITSKTPTAPIFKEQGYSESPQAEFRSNQPRDASAQGSAATHTERQNIVPLPLAGADEASAILLKYNDEARAAYSKLNDYPVEWQNEYRQRLVENPSQDPAALVGIVVLKFLGRPDLAWSSDIWDALETTRNRGKIAIDEFIKVFSLLSHTMTPAVIALKVFDNSRGTVWYTYLVCDENEVEQKVYRYSRDVFSVEGSSETFHNIDAVYQYLNTPLSKRVKLYLLNTVQ
jgi:hypothetical protein